MATGGRLVRSEGAICSLTLLPGRRQAAAACPFIPLILAAPGVAIGLAVTNGADGWGVALTALVTGWVLVLALDSWVRPALTSLRWGQHGAGHVELTNFAALAPGRGDGARLLDRVISDAFDRGLGIVLVVRPANDVARHLYRSRGFVEVHGTRTRAGHIAMALHPTGGRRPTDHPRHLAALTAASAAVLATAAVAISISGFEVFVLGSGLALLVAAATIDRDHLRLPNHLVVPAAVFGVLGCAAVNAVHHAAIGAMLASVPLLLIHLVDPKALGFGDVKFAAAAGTLISAIEPTAAALVPLVGLAIAMAHRIVMPRAARPFGPDLVWATIVVIAASTVVSTTGVGS